MLRNKQERIKYKKQRGIGQENNRKRKSNYKEKTKTLKDRDKPGINNNFILYKCSLNKGYNSKLTDYPQNIDKSFNHRDLDMKLR